MAAELAPEECLAGGDVQLVFAFLNCGAPVGSSGGDLVPRVFSYGYSLFLSKDGGLTGDASTSRLLTEITTAKALKGFGIYIVWECGGYDTS